MRSMSRRGSRSPHEVLPATPEANLGGHGSFSSRGGGLRGAPSPLDFRAELASRRSSLQPRQVVGIQARHFCERIPGETAKVEHVFARRPTGDWMRPCLQHRGPRGRRHRSVGVNLPFGDPRVRSSAGVVRSPTALVAEDRPGSVDCDNHVGGATAQVRMMEPSEVAIGAPEGVGTRVLGDAEDRIQVGLVH